jgi:hypothetical protein
MGENPHRKRLSYTTRVLRDDRGAVFHTSDHSGMIDPIPASAGKIYRELKPIHGIASLRVIYLSRGRA